MTRRGSWIPGCLAVVALSACGVPRVVLPTGPSSPAADAAAIWDSVSRDCRDVQTLSATLTVSGRADGQRLPHVRVLAGLTAKGQILLDAPNVFLMAGTTARASLLLRRDNRLVTAPAGEIVEVLLGVRLEPTEWLALMTGCVTPTPAFRSAQRIGASLEVAIDGGRVFLDSREGEWRPSFANAYGLNVNYRAFEGRQPIAWRASTPQGQLPDAAFAIEATDLRVNQPIPEAAFSIPNAESATPMRIEELRAMFGRK